MFANNKADLRKDFATEEALEMAVAIDRSVGGVAAFVVLRHLTVPSETIIRVLLRGTNVRRHVRPSTTSTLPS